MHRTQSEHDKPGDPQAQAMDNSKLQEFVTKMERRRRITFGDVRRLQRDYLPGGVSNFDEAKMLIRLDAVAERADKTWSEWLVGAMVDFAGERPIAPDSSGTREWINKVLETTGTPTRAARMIARQIRRTSQDIHPASELPARTYSLAAHPPLSGGVDRYLIGIELAA